MGSKQEIALNEELHQWTDQPNILHTITQCSLAQSHVMTTLQVSSTSLTCHLQTGDWKDLICQDLQQINLALCQDCESWKYKVSLVGSCLHDTRFSSNSKQESNKQKLSLYIKRSI